jgi:hypothetical protein
MQADRLNRIIGVLALLYVGYIAIALLWSRLREALRDRKRREVVLSGFGVPLKQPRSAHPFRRAK